MLSFTPIFLIVFLACLISGCAGQRELTLDHPIATLAPLTVPAGVAGLDGDDYYVQFISEFDSDPGVHAAGDCSSLGSGYGKGGSSATVAFKIKNELAKLQRELPVFVYQSASGACSGSIEARKIYLSPWMRLDNAKDTELDYIFTSRTDSNLDLGKIGSDVNAASNLLALTGVGTGVALVGKLASGLVLNNVQQAPQAKEGQGENRDAQRRQETGSLPSAINLGNNTANLRHSTLALFEREVGGMMPFSSVRALGKLKVYADAKSSLLLKIGPEGLPDATDLSLEELWRSTLQSANGAIGLQKFIAEADHPEHPNLKPDANNYSEVESNCRKLKVVMKELGFNRYDRNAVLYYFLDQSPDWRNYNVAGEHILVGGFRLGQLQQYRSKGFSACLAQSDYEAMKRMGLRVNADKDWSTALEQLREKEGYLAVIHALERQLVAALRNTNQGEVERQIFPLLATKQNGSGSVLLQNRLGNFGLEDLLGGVPLPGEGLVVTAKQLAQAFTALKVSELTCARPAFEQGRPIANVAILLFATQTDSPLARGGALEFEFEGGTIGRLAFQNVSFRDFRQDVQEHPEVADCRIDPSWLERI